MEDNQPAQNPVNPPVVPPTTPSSPTPLQSQNPPIINKENKNKSLTFPIAIIMLLIGIGIGIMAMKQFIKPKPTVQNDLANKAPDDNTISLPKDAIVIQECADNKGTLYVEPQNIPDGPVYMMYKGKIIGEEFMLDKQDMIQGQIKKVLKAVPLKTDHVRLGFLSQGHEGYTQPHYHVDFYQVDEATEEAIKCPQGQSQQMSGMDMVETGTESANMTPAPSGTEMKMPMNTSSPTTLPTKQ